MGSGVGAPGCTLEPQAGQKPEPSVTEAPQFEQNAIIDLFLDWKHYSCSWRPRDPFGADRLTFSLVGHNMI